MVFSSLFFIFVFLPLFLVAYYLTPVRHRNWVAMLASILFYIWGAPRFIAVLLGAALVDFLISHQMRRLNRAPQRKAWVALSLCMNVSVLLVFKYANFAIHELNGILTHLGGNTIAWTDIALPIGISFFTFHKVSYIVDVYRGLAVPPRRLSTYLLYLLYFPQLIAGPIIRYHDIAAQLTGRTHTLDRFISGLWRFTIGLAKKVLIANVLARTADAVFDGDFAGMTTPYAWLGILAYSFQIYFDFSGYSDMAIGLGRMAGFEFLENFNMPYIARTFTDFWRRWHISLSNFMREYLYIPLGGNRVRPWRAYLNLWIVFLISGLWHGAAWPFIAWGAFNGLFLTLDRLFWDKFSRRLPGWLTIPLNFLLVLAGWVFFRSRTLPGASEYFKRLAGITAAITYPPILPDILSNRAAAMLAVGALLSFLPAVPGFMAAIERWSRLLGPDRLLCLKGIAVLLLFLVSVCSLANASFNPFIYFRF
jgi:alginate O-acetyltransferase complex protein AlgI